MENQKLGDQWLQTVGLQDIKPITSLTQITMSIQADQSQNQLEGGNMEQYDTSKPSDLI